MTPSDQMSARASADLAERSCSGAEKDGVPSVAFVDVIPSEGTYFLNIDIARFGDADDVEFCRRLVLEHGVAAIPVSAFYAEGAVKNVVRFCFAKRDETLDAALERLSGVVRQAA